MYEVASCCGFDLQFPDANDVAHLFLSLLAICISTLEQFYSKTAYFSSSCLIIAELQSFLKNKL